MLKYPMKLSYYTRFSLIIILVLFITFPTANASQQKFRVTEVHDGDTVSIRTKSLAGFPITIERVRLIGIDSPELKQEPWGRLSKRYLKRLISESDWIVSIEFDIEQRDKYGRLLAYLWSRDGQLINERMLEGGYAVLYTIPPNVKHAERFVAAQKRAQARRLGIWGKKGIRKSPEQWRMEHPGQ